jgi:hypothetical protein
MDPISEAQLMINRRTFFGRTATGIGTAALALLLGREAQGHAGTLTGGSLGAPHYTPRARRVIYLFQSGGPSHLDLFDYKPLMAERQGTELPESVRMGQRLTGMTSGQGTFPVVPSLFQFAQHGQSGAQVSELLPHIAGIADELCFIRSMNTEQINHDPAITFCQTGHQQPGRPSLGAWLNYGLGSMNSDLPGFIVLLSMSDIKRGAQALFQRLWGSGFLPSEYQGVTFRGGADPVLYLSNPAGLDAALRRKMLDGVAELNRMQLEAIGDPEIAARIQQYEMAYRMQTSVPDLMDISDEPDHIFDLYGEDARIPGTFAANCLLARRLAERDVRCIQLYHRDWDHHSDLPKGLRIQCKDVDKATAGLITDLKQRGLLDDTLVIWGGEFGRTIYSQGKITEDNYGRDHHGRCFTIFMAGGGVKRGYIHGETDDYGYNIVRDPVHVHDLNATVLHLMGIDHTRLTYRFQGRDYRLTDVHGNVVQHIIA